MLELGTLPRDHFQPIHIVVQMPLHRWHGERFPEGALHRARSPHGGEDFGERVKHWRGNEAVNVFGVHPDHGLHDLAQIVLEQRRGRILSEHVVPDDGHDAVRVAHVVADEAHVAEEKLFTGFLSAFSKKDRRNSHFTLVDF